MTRNRQIRRYVLIVVTLGWMIFIYYMSAQPATQSSAISDSISYRLVRLVDRILHCGMSGSMMEQYAELIHYPIRKTAHMTEYGILAILFQRLCRYSSYDRVKAKRYWIACILTVLYAATDEFHQLFVPGRAGMLTDVGIDTCGALIALGILYLIQQIRKRRAEHIGGND